MRTAILAATALLAGCLPAPEYVYPVYLPGLDFELYSTNAGIHPFDDILGDPNNVFAEGGVGAETKFQIQDGGGPVAAYYAWGTALVGEPTGEHQFYTAENLREMYVLELADDSELYAVRQMAIAAYQSVLDNFSDDVTYDANGRFGFAVAPLAFDGIVALGGVPQGGWVKVTLADGSTTVIQAPTTIVAEPER